MNDIDHGELLAAIRGADYPVRPGVLVERARDNRASPAITRALARLPDRPFEGPDQVCMAVCGRYSWLEPGP